MAGGEFSIGVEEEYQLVDPASGELRSRASEALATDWATEIYPEIQETMLEVGTRVCPTTVELREELRRLRLHAGSVAAAEDLFFVAAGLHPFSRWEGQVGTDDERYRGVRERFGRVIRSEHVFGMHVHVAIPEGVDRIPLLGVLRWYLPHLLALSASSPLFEGEDTGYASYRTILVRRLPHSGIPPRLSSEREYRRYIDLLLGADALHDVSAIYWSLRPHPRYPTLEFRATDVCPRLDDAVAICALIRALVVAAAEGELDPSPRPVSVAAEDGLLAANEWQASRFGMDATLVEPASESGRESVHEAILRLVDRLGPTAEAMGDGVAFRGLPALLERGNAADRIRHVLPDRAGLPSLVKWLAGETQVGVGMDRRARQRGGWGEPA